LRRRGTSAERFAGSRASRDHQHATHQSHTWRRHDARDLAAGVVADYGRDEERGVACFMDDFDACIAHLRFPVTHRRAIRTTNLLERLFVEERRRLKIIPNAFGERAVLKLMLGALIRAAERWRSVKSPSSNVGKWLPCEKTSTRNTRPRSASKQGGLQRCDS
jgi:Transposase, Mutator family